MSYVVSNGEVSSGIILEKDSMTVLEGGTALETILNSNGRMFVSSGGLAETTVVNSRGSMTLSSGGTATGATVNTGGYLRISSGGKMSSTVVQSGGRLLGYFDCKDVMFESGAALYFDVSTVAPGNADALVDLTGLSGPDGIRYSLLISDSQETGVYKLAEGAAGFDRTISVVNSVMELGSISTDQPVTINGREYTLNLNGDELTLSVIAPTAQYVYLDFDGEALARYRNPDLELEFDLSVADPAFSEE